MIVLVACVVLWLAIDPFFDSWLGEATTFIAGLITIAIIIWLIASLL